MPNIPNPTISQFVASQFPGYIRDSFPLLVDFLEAYYEWLEATGNVQNLINTFISQRDIDRSVDSFLTHFRNEYLLNIPESVIADKRLLVRHIKDFYRSRGTEKSFQFLFRILYNDNVSVYYPKLDILKPSDNDWQVNTVLRCTSNNNTFAWVSRRIEGLTSGASANVENVIQIQLGGRLVSEIYLSNIEGEFVPNENIHAIDAPDVTFQESVYPIISGIDILDGGTGYYLDDVFDVTGSDLANGTLVVSGVFGNEIGRCLDAGNSVPSVVFPLPAWIRLADRSLQDDDYYRGMTITIIDGNGAAQTKTITEYYGTTAYSVDGVKTPVTNVAVLDSDWTTLPNYTSHYDIHLGKISQLQCRDFGLNYINTPTVTTSKGNVPASIKVTVGALGTYSGRFANTRSFLDSNKFIQDSFYYQDFSYVLKAAESIDQYADIVKKLLHPAGMMLFGEVGIFTDQRVGPTNRTLDQHKLFYKPYTRFESVIVDPIPSSALNGTLWGRFPWGSALFGGVDSYGNTQVMNWKNTAVSQLLQFDHAQPYIADVYIARVNLTEYPQDNLVAEYNCVQGANARVLYDNKVVSIATSSLLFNSSFGLGLDGATTYDPVGFNTYGIDFDGGPRWIDASKVPIDLFEQTVVVVGRVDLRQSNALIGCLDQSDHDTVINGYSIKVNLDGSVTFRVQKNGYPLIATLAPGTIQNGEWFLLSLRYRGNKLQGGYGRNRIQTSAVYSGDVDSESVQANSSGWYIGTTGKPDLSDPNFPAAVSGFESDAKWGNFRFGETMFGDFGTYPAGASSFVNGNLAHVAVFNRSLSDNDVKKIFYFLRDNLQSRGIKLNL